MRAKYAHLLEDADVKRWFDNLAAKSIVTAAVYLRTLGFYCELNRTDPKAILKVAGTKAFRDDFTDFIRKMEREGKAGSCLGLRRCLTVGLPIMALMLSLRLILGVSLTRLE